MGKTIFYNIAQSVDKLLFADGKTKFFPKVLPRFGGSEWGSGVKPHGLLCLQACFWRGAERPVDVRLAPTGAKRRPGETFHKWKKFPKKLLTFIKFIINHFFDKLSYRFFSVSFIIYYISFLGITFVKSVLPILSFIAVSACTFCNL
mgnify:CR=1 FL=1